MHEFISGEQNDKPGSVMNDHLSCTAVASRVQRPTWKQAGQACRLHLGLASDGVYMAPHVTVQTVVSYTAFPPSPHRSVAVYFCCTGLGVASTGRYPASCPVKPGLSSPAPCRRRARSFILLTVPHYIRFSGKKQEARNIRNSFETVCQGGFQQNVTSPHQPKTMLHFVGL